MKSKDIKKIHVEPDHNPEALLSNLQYVDEVPTLFNIISNGLLKHIKTQVLQLDEIFTKLIAISLLKRFRRQFNLLG